MVFLVVSPEKQAENCSNSKKGTPKSASQKKSAESVFALGHALGVLARYGHGDRIGRGDGNPHALIDCGIGGGG